MVVRSTFERLISFKFKGKEVNDRHRRRTATRGKYWLQFDNLPDKITLKGKHEAGRPVKWFDARVVHHRISPHS